MYKKQYTRLLIILTLTLTLSGQSPAQENQPTAVATERGVWIYLGKEIPDGFEYQVLKSEGNGDFVPLGTTAYRDDPATMKSAVEKYYPLFGNLEKPSDSELSFLRDYASRSRTTDSVYISNLPLMHLMLGTAFFDPEVSAGKTYRYRVAKISGRDRIWESTSNRVNFPPETDLPRPKFDSKQEFASQVVVRWYVTGESSLNSFLVYRRVFGKGEYQRLDIERGFNISQDTVYLIASDTEVQNPALYEYYIRPLDIYGNSGPESEAVTAGTLGSVSYPVPDYFNARGGEKDHRVELSWKFNETEYLRSIELYRSKSYDDGYMRIARLSPNDTSFTDIVPVANENFWYYLITGGPNGNSPPSAKVSAMFRNSGEKPLPPEETGAESIKNGVMVYWSCQEPYTKGFYVYRYIYETAEFEQVSGLIPAGAEIYSFADTARYLQGNEVYRYAVRTVNDVDQISDFSETASASPGKKATVGSPMNLRITRRDKGILLIWDDMRTTEPVLLGYKIFRKEDPDGRYELLPGDTLKNELNFYWDTTLVTGKAYRYTVTAIDFYGNESPQSVSVSYLPEASTVIAPEILRAVNTKDGILVSWGQVTDENAVAVKVYRSRPGMNPLPVITLQKTSDEYLDKSVSDGELYTYEISVISEGDRESLHSSGVTVRRQAED
jgi:fibronectin type 3 domain-containing protein